MTEPMLNETYWVIDFLPEQVPAESAGQFFDVEKYYLQQPALADLHCRFANILLKLNCYYDFCLMTPDEERYTVNPAPESLASWITEGREDLRIVLPGADAMIVLNHDDTHMTVYHPSKMLLARLARLVSAEGLFIWQPVQHPATDE